MTAQRPPKLPLRILYLFCAALFFVLGVIGIIAPGWPTTPMLLLTSFFLVRSSPRLNERLLNSKLFGPILVDWQQNGIVQRHIKFRAISVVVISVAISAWLTHDRPFVLIPMLIGAIIGITVIYRLPSEK